MSSSSISLSNILPDISPEIAPCQPTPERMQKDDFETFPSSSSSQMGKTIRKKLNTLQTLYTAKDIDDSAVNAASRWLRDYLFSHFGYADFLNEPLPKDYIKGDIHTFNMARGKAGAVLDEIRHSLGYCAHQRLILLLVEELSFSKMGEKLYPHSARSVSRAKASAQSALLLEQLAAFYEQQHKARQREHKLRIFQKDQSSHQESRSCHKNAPSKQKNTHPST